MGKFVGIVYLSLGSVKDQSLVRSFIFSGYTVYGIEEICLRYTARENAITTFLLEFIPEDKHALEKMQELEREYYKSIGLGEGYAQMEDKEGYISIIRLKKYIIIPSKRENAIEVVLPFIYLRYATHGLKYTLAIVNSLLRFFAVTYGMVLRAV